MADVQELIAKAGFIGPVPDATRRKFERFSELVRAECAQMCLETVNEGNYAYARACRDCAAATREGKS